MHVCSWIDEWPTYKVSIHFHFKCFSRRASLFSVTPGNEIRECARVRVVFCSSSVSLAVMQYAWLRELWRAGHTPQRETNNCKVAVFIPGQYITLISGGLPACVCVCVSTYCQSREVMTTCYQWYVCVWRELSWGQCNNVFCLSVYPAACPWTKEHQEG